ncbi:hypothetical protein OWV82_006488 [Melia azedarach]|uniref:Uncharacterized protein n=1 Tax=Melia azedarach TaxID=155640 RepID=A0ACC1YI14_MELAZ|nr:hypothetical protein OWV82_006488 [Melia azedarach]
MRRSTVERVLKGRGDVAELIGGGGVGKRVVILVNGDGGFQNFNGLLRPFPVVDQRFRWSRFGRRCLLSLMVVSDG